jgi:hypothetical protein
MTMPAARHSDPAALLTCPFTSNFSVHCTAVKRRLPPQCDQRNRLGERRHFMPSVRLVL